MSGSLAEVLVAGAAQLGMPLTAAQAETLLGYLRLLARWSRAYNLTAVVEPEAGVVRHLLDSLAVGPLVRGARCLDVATGAGLPGLVLAVAQPTRRWTLLDSNGKKARFCRQAVIDLALPNVEVVQCRVEDFRPEDLFDTVTARAWAPAGEVVRRVARLVRAGGRVVLLKGGFPAAELSGVEMPPGRVSVHRLEVPGLPAERHAVVVEVDGAAAASGGPG